MKIAVTSPNAKSISGHAGKCPGFLLYEILANGQYEQTHIKLGKEDVFKNLAGPLSTHPHHPLNGIDVFVTQSLGDGLLSRLERDNIKVIQTQETDPENFIQNLIQNLIK